MKTDEGTNGRSGERSERFPNRMFKYNRANLSYQEMFERRREEGDLFAVFQNDMGEIRVEYARVEDYDEFAFEQIERSSASQRRGLTAEDVNEPRQGFPDVYIPDGYVDVVRASHVLQSNTLHGEHMLVFESPSCTEVDNAGDFDYLEYQLQQTGSPLLAQLRQSEVF